MKTQQPQPQQPSTTVVVQQSEGTSGMAIAGLVFSILGLLTFGLFSIPGALLSFVALFSRGPKGVAIAGLIVCFPGVLFFALIGMGMALAIVGIGAGTNAVIRVAADTKAATTQVDALQRTIDMYKFDTKQLPASFVDFVNKPSNPDIDWKGPYLQSSNLNDPWGNPYRYEPQGKRNVESYDVWSAGPDGQDGTADDIGNWSFTDAQVATETETIDEEEEQDSDQSELKTDEPSDIEDPPAAQGSVDEDMENPLTAQSLDNAAAEREREAQAAKEAKEAQLKAEEEASYRVWTSANGKMSPEAKIKSYANGVVTLETRNGKTAKVPLDKLIDEDKDFISTWRKQR
jgi:general secretion pathway protein G